MDTERTSGRAGAAQQAREREQHGRGSTELMRSGTDAGGEGGRGPVGHRRLRHARGTPSRAAEGPLGADKQRQAVALAGRVRSDRQVGGAALGWALRRSPPP